MNKDPNAIEKELLDSLVCCNDLSATKENEEDRLYEILCQKAEETAQKEIFVLVNINDLRLNEQLRAIFRAAIYGKFSLLFQRIHTKAEVEKAKAAANTAFLELLEDGREFNGFLSKGILIDTPMTLLSHLPSQGFDFFCLDLLRICERMTGNKIQSRSDWADLQEILSAHLPKEIPCRAIVSEELKKAGVGEWLKEQKILGILF